MFEESDLNFSFTSLLMSPVIAWSPVSLTINSELGTHFSTRIMLCFDTDTLSSYIGKLHNLPLSLIEHKGAVTGRLLPLFPFDKWSNSLAAWILYSWFFCHYWQMYLTGTVACIRIPFLKVRAMKLKGTNIQYPTFTKEIYII